MARSKYDPGTFPLRAEELARDGFSDKEIFIQLGISKDTFYKYLKKYSDFSDALRKGREPINAKVENAFLKRCLGFEYEEVTTEGRLTKNGTTKVMHKKITKKTVLPDVNACRTWLQAKKPEVWKERKEVEITGFRSFAELMMEVVKNGKN